MSRKFKVAVGLLATSSDPADGSTGDLYFNTDVNDLKAHNGTAWVEVGSRSVDGGTPDSVYTDVPSLDGGGVL